MKKLIILTLSLLLICCKKSIKASKDDIMIQDSLSYYLKKIEDLNEEEKIKANSKILKIFQENDSNNLNINLLKRVSENFYQLYQETKLKESSLVLLDKAIKRKDTNHIADAYNLLGRYYSDLSKNDSSFYFFVKAEKLYNIKRDTFNLSKIYIQKAKIQLDETNFIESLNNSFTALRYLKSKKSLKELYNCYLLIGDAYDEISEYENAINYYKKALNILEDSKRMDLFNPKLHLESSINNNIGYVYKNMGDHKIAIEYFNVALNGKNLKNDSPKLFAMALDNLAYSKLQLNDYSLLPELFFKALKIREEKKIISGAILNKIHLSEYYSKVGDTLNGKKYSLQALKQAKLLKENYDILIALKQSSIVDKGNASKYSLEYIQLRDSLQVEERKNKDRFARIEFETDEIAKEKETAIRQKWVQTAIIATVLLIVILLFIIYRQRSHQKELKLLQSQQEANAEIYRLMLHQQTQTEEVRQHEKQRIALELHDNVMNKLASSRFNLFPLTQNPDQHIQQHASQQAQTLKEIEDEIRNLTHELATPQTAERNSFEDLLHAFTEEQNRKGDLQFTLHLDPSINWDTVASEAKMHLYRIVQEGVHNIRKHAEATQVSIRTTQSENTLGLELQDNGKGFDTTTTHKGIGLQNMQNRMKSVGGRVSIHSHLGKTTIQVCIPAQHNK